ncbi:hypothetical protein G7046_g1388 [Stylonectria norvegica]|nr:hypothetical protein G7046_g1388 [Stylonectria norvegica]
MVLAVDLLNPSAAAEAKKHKLKTLVPGPRSFFMDVKCPGCFTITTVFSHAQTVVICQGCTTVLCQPTGGKARLTEGCSFRRKRTSQHSWIGMLFLTAGYYFVTSHDEDIAVPLLQIALGALPNFDASFASLDKFVFVILFNVVSKHLSQKAVVVTQGFHATDVFQILAVKYAAMDDQ